jgi:hypothetical protein
MMPFTGNNPNVRVSLPERSISGAAPKLAAHQRGLNKGVKVRRPDSDRDASGLPQSSELTAVLDCFTSES